MMSATLRCLVAVLLIAPWLLLASPRAGGAGTIAIGGMVVVATTDGDVLALRAGPGVEHTALAAFAAGAELPVLAGPVPGEDGRPWYQVTGAGLVGWSAAEWVTPPATGGDTRCIGGSDGGANLRSAPILAGGVLPVIPEGGAVVLLSAEDYADGIAWSLVRYGTTTGWVTGLFLGGSGADSGGEPADDASSAPPVPSRAGLVIGGNAMVVGTDGYDLRLRDGIGPAAPIFSTISAATVVTVVNGPLADEAGAPWYGVAYDGIHGWVRGEHLAPTDAPTSGRQPGTAGRATTGSSWPSPRSPRSRTRPAARQSSRWPPNTSARATSGAARIRAGGTARG